MSTKFLYGVEGKYKNVTFLVKKYFLKNGKYEFKNVYYNAYFGDHVFGAEKHLRIEHEGDFFFVKENSDFILDTRKIDEKKKINIVYFINVYVSPIFYKNLIIWQFSDLRKSGILDEEDTCLYIEACTNMPQEFSDLIKSLNLPNKIVITFHSENNHEYYGIRRVWELRDSEDSYILYFHSKGITRLAIKGRDNIETELLNPTVIIEWRRNLRILNIFDSVYKVGLCTNRYVWYNFFWVKPEYLNNLEEPIITTDRYYYEDWLARIPRVRDVVPETLESSLDVNLESDSNLVSTLETPLEYNEKNYIFNEYDCFNLNYSIKNSVYNISPPVVNELVASCRTH